MIVPQLVEQSAKGKRGASKMPQVVAECGQRQLADKNLQQVVAELVSVPWGHYRTIIGMLKATTVNVSGVMIGGKGYGTASVKKLGSLPVTIELNW